MTEENKFQSEYILHKLTEKYLKDKDLKEKFGLDFVASERQLSEDCLEKLDASECFDEKIKLKDENFKKFDCPKLVSSKKQMGNRLDTIAFDNKTNTLVIIEYKNRYNKDVIDQARRYLCLVKKCPKYFAKRLADSEIEEKEFEFDDIRVMIIGTKFKKEQIENTYGFEIWKVFLDKRNHKVTYAKMKTDKITEKKLDFRVEPEDLELRQDDTYNLLEKLENKNFKTNWDLYLKLKELICKKDIKPRFLVDGVSFRRKDQIVCIINLRNKLKIHYFTDKFKDDEKIIVVKKIADVKVKKAKNDEKIIVRDISRISTGGKAKYEFVLESENEIDDAFYLFEQVHLEKGG